MCKKCELELGTISKYPIYDILDSDLMVQVGKKLWQLQWLSFHQPFMQHSCRDANYRFLRTNAPGPGLFRSSFQPESDALDIEGCPFKIVRNSMDRGATPNSFCNFWRFCEQPMRWVHCARVQWCNIQPMFKNQYGIDSDGVHWYYNSW